MLDAAKKRRFKKGRSRIKSTKSTVIPRYYTLIIYLTPVDSLIETPIMRLSVELQTMIVSFLPGCAAVCLALTSRRFYVIHRKLANSALIPHAWETWSQNHRNLLAFDLSTSRVKPSPLHRLLETWIGENFKFCEKAEKFVAFDRDSACTCTSCKKPQGDKVSIQGYE